MRFPHTVRHLILGLALAAALSGTAHAVPLTWIVNGALQQGALTQAFSGGFVFDIDQTPLSSNPVFCDASCFSSVFISTSDGPVPFTLAVPSNSTFNGQLVATSAFAPGAPAIIFSTGAPTFNFFTNAGGTFLLDPGTPGLGTCFTAACTSFTDTWIITSGSVSATPVSSVPEPGTLGLLALGLVGLLLARGRRHTISH